MLLNMPRYVAAVLLGPLAAHSSSEQAWSRIPWVGVAGCVLFGLWIVALLLRRSGKAWFAAAWFVLLLAPVLPLRHQFYFYYATCALPGLWASLILVASPASPSRLRTHVIALITLAIVVVQSLGAHVREHSMLQNADLPSDFVLRRAVIAHNVLTDIAPKRDRIRASVAVVGQQPIPTAAGGMITTRATNYAVDPYWDVDIRSALYEGGAIRLIAPQVREIIFPRWISSEDSTRTIIQCEIDGYARLMSFDEYADIPPVESSDPLRSRILRANRFIELRMFPDAARELQIGVELSPSDPTLFLNLGTTLAAIGDSSGAREAFSRALALAPDDVDVRFNLGLLYWRRGAKARAEETWAPVIRAAPSSDLAQRIQALLKGRAR